MITLSDNLEGNNLKNIKIYNTLLCKKERQRSSQSRLNCADPEIN